MKITGTGEVFLADLAQDVHLIYLENDYITCNGGERAGLRRGHRLGHQDRARRRRMGGGYTNMSLHGTGWVAIISNGPPVLLNVARPRRSSTRRRRSPGRPA